MTCIAFNSTLLITMKKLFLFIAKYLIRCYYYIKYKVFKKYDEEYSEDDNERWRKNIARDFVKEILDPKQQFLTNKLVDFLNSNPNRLLKDGISLRVIYFERDSHQHFKYAIFPSWEIYDDQYFTASRYEDFSFVGNYDEDDLLKIINKYEDYDLLDEDYSTQMLVISEVRPVLNSLEIQFLSECWKKAKQITGADLRAFVSFHEDFVYYDLDRNVDVEHDNLIEYLQAEKFDFKVHH